MTETVILAGARTPIAKLSGGLTAFSGTDLGGLAIAEALATAGARIAVHGLAGDAQIDEVCTHLTRAGASEAAFFPGDLRNPEEIGDLMRAVSGWGGADILVNNAGIQHTAPVTKMPAETWDSILAVNLSAAFHTMQAVLPEMIRRGYGRVGPDPGIQGRKHDPL